MLVQVHRPLPGLAPGRRPLPLHPGPRPPRTCSLRRRIRPESSMAAAAASAPGREEGGGGGGGGRREGVRSRGDRRGGGGSWEGGAGAERSGAGPTPSLRMGAQAGSPPKLSTLGAGL